MFKKFPKNVLLLIIVVAAVAIGEAAIFVNFRKCPGSGVKGKIMPAQEVGKRVVDFINNDLFQGRANVVLIGVAKEEDSGMYKVTINLQGKKFDSYATLDGKFLYPERYNMNEALSQEPGTEKTKKTCKTIKKNDKPLMEAFVVSRCPFGLQMQRILAEIGKNISSLMDNVKVRYIGSIVKGKIVSMHGDKEAQENLKQICIREEQKDKYWDYISCYIKKGDSQGCSKSVGIDINKLKSCESDSSRGLKYAKEDFNLQDKYKVSGSPTLILNGEKVSEFDFGGRTAEAVKNLLCCGFKNSPADCSKKLTTDSAAVGLSDNYSSAASAGGKGKCQ